MGRDGSGRLHVRRATAAGQERDSVSKNTTGPMTPRQFGRDFSEQIPVRTTARDFLRSGRYWPVAFLLADRRPSVLSSLSSRAEPTPGRPPMCRAGAVRWGRHRPADLPFALQLPTQGENQQGAPDRFVRASAVCVIAANLRRPVPVLLDGPPPADLLQRGIGVVPASLGGERPVQVRDRIEGLRVVRFVRFVVHVASNRSALELPSEHNPRGLPMSSSPQPKPLLR
jgi:hypothetical protein